MPPMLRALLAAMFALVPTVALAQTQAPPDTKPARERHRLADKEPPPPSGPWGPEEAGLTWHTPVWRGVFVQVGTYSAASLVMNVPRGVATQSDGVNPPVFETLEYHAERFRTTSIGAVADFDMIRLSAEWFDGTFDARATLKYEDGFAPPQTSSIAIDGNIYGFRIGVQWPALRWRGEYLEASAGLATTVGWMHQETHLPTGVLLRRDTVDILTGSFGPKASLRGMWGRVAVDLSAEYSFLTGSARGWAKEFSFGVGYAF